jgi:hypothetical protein
LTGLSTDQLREWTSRRALIPADVQHRGRGSPAQYSWQTLLLLRIAAALKGRFHLELHAHRELFASMREVFDGISFLRLWDGSIAIYDTGHWELLESGASCAGDSDSLVLQLDSHLQILTAEFGMPTPAAAGGQLELFPARLVRDEMKIESNKAVSDIQPFQKRQRA